MTQTLSVLIFVILPVL